MATGIISFNPNVTTNATGTFLSNTEGYVQGALLDDPVAQQWIATGQIASTASTPIWAGLPITETGNVTAGTAANMGPSLALATAVSNITGFVIANQAYNMLITPGNQVQVALANMSVSFVRLGSQARIAVAIDSAALASLENVAVNTQLSWDFTNNALNSYSSGTALSVKLLTINTNSKIVSYNSGTGAVNWTTGAAAIIQI